MNDYANYKILTKCLTKYLALRNVNIFFLTAQWSSVYSKTILMNNYGNYKIHEIFSLPKRKHFLPHRTVVKRLF